MKRTISSLWVCVFMSLVGAATAGGETVFLPGTPEVDQLVTMYREAGRVFPTTSFPVSKAELARFAASLATSASGDLMDDLQAYQDNVLAFNTSHDSISASGSASFEYTYRTRNVNFDPGLPTEIQILDLQRLFLQQLPLASAMLDYSRDSGFELGISAKVEREYFLDPFNATNLWESDPAAGNPLAIENQDIMRGFIWYDFHPLQVTLGRDMVSIGPGSHSLFPSMDLPYLDMLRLRLPVGRLTGDLLISTLENRQRGNPAGDVTLVSTEPQFGTTLILMAMHRYEYAFDFVRVGIGALAVYARLGNAYSLGDIFPVFSWHQADIGSNHLTLVADVSWMPLPGLSIEGQAGVQSVNLGAIGVTNQAVPTIPAAIVTIGYKFVLPAHLKLDSSCEVGYTHYLWGNFSPDPYGNPDMLARDIDRYYLDGGNVILPLNSPYGPGATWVELTAALHGMQWLDASISARYFSRMTDPNGPDGSEPVNLVDTLYQRSPAIEAAPHVDTWSVGARVAALPFGFLTLSVEPTLYLQIDNRTGARTTWMELSLGVSVHGDSVTRIAHD